MEIKKSEKADLRNNITVYALLGLAFMLLVSWQAIEFTVKEVEEVPEEVFVMGDVEEEAIPITQMLNTPPPPPPPPPAPEIIEVVEDEVEIEEDIIESTEVEEEEEIVEIDEISEEVGVVEEIAEVPFAVIENVPIFPGCEGLKTNTERKKCMSDKITAHVNRRFDTGLANELGLEGRQRISVLFKIDNFGNVVDIQSRAPHPRLQKEALDVISQLPKMKPGMQRGKAVKVAYSLPIFFEVQN